MKVTRNLRSPRTPNGRVASKRRLERRLADLAGFRDPDEDLEQYETPAELAANLLHRAGLHGDLDGDVVDLGAGTGMLAIGAALAGPDRVIGVEADRSALWLARRNEASVDPPVGIAWLQADARRPPLCPASPVTVLMNPPFGAQRSSVGDRGFLASAARLADVSYSIHNAGSREFVEAFAADNGGSVSHAYASEIPLDRRFPFHSARSRDIDVEVYRIEWDQR